MSDSYTAAMDARVAAQAERERINVEEEAAGVARALEHASFYVRAAQLHSTPAQAPAVIFDD